MEIIKGVDIRQVILLAVAFLVPAVLFLMGKSRAILGWVCFTLFVHVFDTRILTNLPATRVVGLIYLPYALLLIPSWIRLKPARILVINFICLAILGVAFGVIWPWHASEISSLNFTPWGRATVFLIRTLADLSLTVFVYRELRQPGGLTFAAKMIVIGTTTTAVVALFDSVTLGDTFSTVTGMRSWREIDSVRVRGLSYEPRGLGMACVYGFVITVLFPGAISTLKKIALVLINLLGFLVAFSTSALALLLGGSLVMWLFLPNRKRLTSLAYVGVFLVAVFGILAVLPQDRIEDGTRFFQQRLDKTDLLRGAVADSLAEKIAYRLDSFDASAILFLADRPFYAITGTGPGMMMLPASGYTPPGVYSDMYADHLDGLPTHGLLFELSNTGIIGVAMWLLQILFCWKALQKISPGVVNGPSEVEWQFGKRLFALAVVFYLIQLSAEAPVWSVMLAIGWAATDLVSDPSYDGEISSDSAKVVAESKRISYVPSMQ